jgi:hypothetical protein
MLVRFFHRLKNELNNNHMKRKICIFILIIFYKCSIDIWAQSYSFKVLTFSGKISYQSSSTEPWKSIKTSESLKKDYKVRLEKNSYTALMYNDGRTMEIQEEGIFEIKDLEQNIKQSKISVTQKFTNFVAQEIITDKSEKKNMKTFAAVVRVKPNHIDAAIPSFTSVLDPKIDFSWYSYPSTGKYIFSILSSENTPIFMDLVEDTSYSLDAEKLKLYREMVYKWCVFDADNPKIVSDTNAISVISNDNRVSILDTLQMLSNEIESFETPLNVLSLGAFYERNNLNVEALNQFNKVVHLVPESEEYKKLFLKFLIKHKLYIRASELLEEK